ncbi:MAG: hypothetical protein HY046_04150, partial [Acidobacteria bacterium]|nr:hypothetical protein [Acidobacteriota bacterium]
MVRFLEKLLNLQAGDLARGGLLFSYLFFVMASYVIGKTVSTALFLDQFSAPKLAYINIVILFLVWFVAVGYVSLARRISLRSLLLGSLVFYSFSFAACWYLALTRGKDLPWLYTAIILWVNIFGVLAPAQVWTLANFFLTTREAKRVFGIVGSGAITGGIVAGWLTVYATKKWNVESLLLIMAIFMAASIGLVILIYMQRRMVPNEASGGISSGLEEESADIRQSFKTILSSPYLLAICAVICMSSMATATAKWQFTAVAKGFIPNKADLTAFLGGFNFYAGMVSLLAQLLLTSRLLRRFGIGPALFILPVTVMLGTGSLLVWGSLAAANFMRGGDQVLRYSIDKSTVELLFLPIPSNIKIQVKSFIDVVVWRFGDGISGLAIALFADQL